MALLLCVVGGGAREGVCRRENKGENRVGTDVLECEKLMCECVMGWFHREGIFWQTVSSAHGRNLRVSLPCRDTETINLRVDLTAAPQDKGLTHSSLHGSNLVDFDSEFMFGLIRALRK